jgi:hypothetical protein
VRTVVIVAVLLLGVLVAIRGFGGDLIPRAIAGGLAAVLIVGSLGVVLYDGLSAGGCPTRTNGRTRTCARRSPPCTSGRRRR